MWSRVSHCPGTTRHRTTKRGKPLSLPGLAMHEVVHLSFGPQANEVNSAFYNRQTEYFVYTKEDAAKSAVDPNVRFVYGREYTPRALFWDYRNGFGKWQQYNENYEAPQSAEAIARDQLPMAPAPPGSPSRSSTSQGFSSWTSRLKFPIHPKSAHTIPDWEIDYSTAPFGRQRGAPEGQQVEFDTMDEGEEQFQAMGNRDDYMDETLRPLLEKCDLLDGVNLVTDLGGWAGFTAPYLELMRDEYLPRQPVFTWAVSRNSPKIKWAGQVSRLKALASLAEFSSLVLPLQDGLAETDFAANAASHLRAFETTCLLSSLRNNRVSMHSLYEDLTMNAPRASIAQVGDNRLREFAATMEPTKTNNTVNIFRGAQRPAELDEPRARDENLRQYWCTQPLPHQDPTSTYTLKLETNDAPLQLRKLVARAPHDLRELVFDLTEPYVWGWHDSDDDDFI